MRDMKINVLPRKSDRRIELSFTLLEKLNALKNPSQTQTISSQSSNDTVISLDIPNAMRLISELESGIQLLMEHVHETLATLKQKSTPELAQEDPTHRKKA